MGHFPVQGFRCDDSFSSAGTQTRRQVSTFQLSLLVIILPEGEATQPLRSAKEITELGTHRLRILDSIRQSSTHVSGRSQDQLVVEDDSALAVRVGQSQPQSEAPLYKQRASGAASFSVTSGASLCNLLVQSGNSISQLCCRHVLKSSKPAAIFLCLSL